MKEDKVIKGFWSSNIPLIWSSNIPLIS